MLEINGFGTPNVQISKTQVRKHLNIYFNFFFYGFSKTIFQGETNVTKYFILRRIY